MLIEWQQYCPRKNGALHFVFPSLGRLRNDGTVRGGGGPLSYTNYRNRVWVKAFAQMTMPYVTPHSARHTFISTLQAQGAEVGLVAQLAGHANPAVTLSHYTQAVRGGALAVERLDAAYTARG
jgi:integrase